MNWETEGFFSFKKKFRENLLIINVFTKSKGRVSGIVYGGNSRKIRNYLQLGNKIFLEYNAKSENKIGYLKTELIEPIAPKYFDDQKGHRDYYPYQDYLTLYYQSLKIMTYF